MDADSDWQEVARIPLPSPAPHTPPTPATAFAFDTSQELIWAGNEYGRVTSFYGAELQRYTSYRGHTPHEGAVKQILVLEQGVISVGPKSVHFAEKRGRTIWHLTRNEFQDLRGLCFTSKGHSEILVAGCQAQMFKIDVESGHIIESLPSNNHYTLLRQGGQYICAATSTGFIQLLDQKNLSTIRSWRAHLGWVNDMDANSSFLVTCGWSPRQNYGSMLDPLAKVFDLKTLMPLPPVPFHVGAAYVRMHPRMLSTGIIASRSGQLQFIDIMNSSMVGMRQVNLVDSYLAGIEIATSGESLALIDSVCFLQLWGSPSGMRFTNYSHPTEFPDSEQSNSPNVDWQGQTPLNVVGIPYYKEVLFSAWPSHMVFEVGALPPNVDPAVLAALTRTEFGAYAPNPRTTKRNQALDTRASDKGKYAFEGPRFLSEQAKDIERNSEYGRRMSDVLESFQASNIDNEHKLDVPVMYRNVEIKYSKFGVDDFDFEYYNRTKFSGLETHIANSYLNPLLQLMKFTPWIRNLALHHTASNCLFENCLLCELGFLCDMLEKAGGQNCQATNFLRTFTCLSTAASLGLLEGGSPLRPLTLMIQATNRFLLEKIAADFRQITPQSPHLDKAISTVWVSSIRCAACANETVRPGGSYVYELHYPPRPPSKHVRTHGPTFSQILKGSVERSEQTRGWCDRCKRYQHLISKKSIRNVPPVLMINAAVHSSDAKQLWAKSRWVPHEVGIIVDQGQFFCYEGQDLNIHLQRGVFKIAVYELIGVVADINSGEHQKSHLVSLINVSPSQREKHTENDWHLFNDFLVRKLSSQEALRFDPTWKLPSILTYQLKTARHGVDDTWKQNLDTSILYRKWPLNLDEDPKRLRTLAFPSERPRPGTPVGIDAEFVSLQQEELEIKADGSRSVLRPSRLGLGRVSVLRGGYPPTTPSPDSEQQPLEPPASITPSPNPADLTPFIDDYIHISEPIVDYLTAFSGISPGDLHPSTSPYTATGRLVSLKTAYKKLWLLLNLGVVFVGHGLPKDLRTINIHVPKVQVIDTVDLFFDRRRARKLSLRFLSWYLLGERVQVEGESDGRGHDSVVDARMAVRLWERWRELERRGKTEKVIDEIYRKGRELGFKVPVAMAGSTVAHGRVRSEEAGSADEGVEVGKGATAVDPRATTEG